MFFGIGSIFMLHRTAPYRGGNIIHNENLKISSEELEILIREWKRKKCIFVSLDEVTEIIRCRKHLNHKFVALTLDDGYKDNLVHGYPIFKAHKIPFCIYVTNSFPNQTTDLWWFALESLVLNNETLAFPEMRVVANDTKKKKAENFLILRENILTKHFKNPLIYLQQFGEFDFDVSKARSELCLSWDDIVELSEDSLTTIGCHTVNHYPLSKLDPNDVIAEITNSKDELEKRLRKPIKHFAFPFGSIHEANQREYEIAASVGFDTIVTTVHGNVHPSADLQKLDRIFLSPLHQSSLFKRQLFWDIKSAITTIKNFV